MSTFVAWVLIVTFGGSYDASVIVIDNIASLEACRHTARRINPDGFLSTRCIPVAKVRP